MVKIDTCAALVKQHIEIYALIPLLKLSVYLHIDSNSKAGKSLSPPLPSYKLTFYLVFPTEQSE